MEPEGILGWIITVLLVLLVATLVILYFRGSFRRKIDYPMRNVPRVDEPNFFLAIAGFASSLPTHACPIGFYVEADEIYAARLQAIQSAQRTIHFETFYMTPGRRADDFAIALSERAQAGVSVQLVVDCHGSSSIPKKYWRSLKAAGVEVHFFSPFSWKAPLDYNTRTHRKLLLIDGEVALIGGAGVSDEWDGKSDTGGTAPWRDFEVRYEGSILSTLEGVFMENWTTVGGTADLSSQVFQPCPPKGQTAFVTMGTFSPENSALHILFQASIQAARRRLWISSPYLVPDKHTRKVLMEASKAGVDVRILTMGVRNDKAYVYYTARELYGDLLKAGVKIYEYEPNMLHAKVVLVDDTWVSHGSTNMDERSFFLNDEMNVSVSDRHLAQQVENFLLDSFAKSALISLENWQNRSFLEKVRGKFGLLFRQLL
jgi:cardiolipin synthase A/B